MRLENWKRRLVRYVAARMGCKGDVNECIVIYVLASILEPLAQFLQDDGRSREGRSFAGGEGH